VSTIIIHTTRSTEKLRKLTKVWKKQIQGRKKLTGILLVFLTVFLWFLDPSWRENDRVLLYNATAQFKGWLGLIFAKWPQSYISSIV
jgi:hypothetical protein